MDICRGPQSCRQSLGCRHLASVPLVCDIYKTQYSKQNISIYLRHGSQHLKYSLKISICGYIKISEIESLYHQPNGPFTLLFIFRSLRRVLIV